jgi:glycosyltransferase involved in cell wall biosynthesis
LPSVGVVIPTKDRRSLLAATLGSVLAQRSVELEVVVVDDGSSDDTATWVRSLRDPRVHVVCHEASRGTAAARNRGLDELTSTFVAFIDDDDLWAPFKLAEQVAALEAAAGAEWSCVGAVGVDQSGAIIYESHPPRSGDVAADLLLKDIIPGGGSGVLGRTAFVRDVGGFDERLRHAEDWEFWIRLALRSPVASVDAPLVGYRVWRGSRSHTTWTSGAAAEIAERYRAEFERRGLRFDPVESWLYDARQDVRARRRRASRRFARAAVHRRRPQYLAASVASLLAPSVVDQLAVRRTRLAVSEDWRSRAYDWLGALRPAAP